MEHDQDWPARMTAQIGERVARLRAERKMTVQAVADRCAELGVPLSRVTLTKLEGGNRQAITPAELIVLAAALRAAPAELLWGIGYTPQVEILPGRMVDPLGAVRWFAGEVALDAEGEATTLSPAAIGKESSVYLLQMHRDYIAKVEVADFEAVRAMGAASAPGADERAAENASYTRRVAADWREFTREPLRRIRSEMRRRGMILPALPAGLHEDNEEGEK